MKYTLNAILHLPSAILADMAAREEKRRRARIVRHPENGGRLLVHESKTMKFRPSSLLWKE